MKNITKKEKVIISIVFVIFLVYAFTLIFPFAWMFINSFKTNSEFFKNIWAFPETFTLKSYINVSNFYVRTSAGQFNILSMFGISVFLTVVGTFLSIMFSAMAAYVVSRYKFKGSSFIYSLAIFIMIVPIVGTLPAQYRLMQNLGLYDSILGILVLYSGAFGFNFFMLHGFFKNISWSYAEAAFIDGAGDFTVFWKIMLPIAKPSLIALSIIHSIGLWNDYITPSIYLKKYPTLAVGIRTLLAEMTSRAAFPEMFATMIIALVPILIFFIVFQSTIVKNTIVGGLKG
jgi:ABC-type glycerol-3-phosphate transport system permease component